MNSVLWFLGVIIVVMALVYVPAIPLGYFEERRKEAEAGTGPGPSTTLAALAWLARIYYVIMAVWERRAPTVARRSRARSCR
jgi:hypothetical protein